MEQLPNNSLADQLFEYLAVRSEMEKVKLCKELDPKVQGKIEILSELLDLFYPVKSTGT